MVNPMQLTGKNILIVGYESDIDKAIINRVTDLEAKIVIYQGNNDTNIEYDIKDLVKNYGSFDGIVFTLVHSDFRPLQYVKPELVRQIMYDNYGMFIEVMRSLKKAKGINDGGSIVAISSISSIRAMKAKMAFCSSKAALDAAIRCLAIELGEKGIRINGIQKGYVDSDFKKSHIQDIASIRSNVQDGRFVIGITKSEEIANLVSFLLSDATKTITGSSIVIDGGYTI